MHHGDSRISASAIPKNRLLSISFFFFFFFLSIVKVLPGTVDCMILHCDLG